MAIPPEKSWKNKISVPLFSCVLNLGVCVDNVTHELSQREFVFLTRFAWVTVCDTHSLLRAVDVITSSGGLSPAFMSEQVAGCPVIMKRLLQTERGTDIRMNIGMTVIIKWAQHAEGTDQSQSYGL